MSEIKVNILKNLDRRKPESKEYGRIQKIICTEENIKEMDFKAFAKYVGEFGCHWKSALVVDGSKNENFKEAYVLALDFDNGITIEEFQTKANDLGLAPSFIYKTFSHTEEHHKFRAVWRLNEVITMPQLKNALQLMIMEVFPQCDDACKDLSRLYVGGKELYYYDDLAVLSLDNLLNALVNVIKAKEPNQVNRNIKAFCKKIGINIYNKYPFAIKNDFKSVENHEESNKYINREVRENRQLFDEIETFEYDNMIFSFDTKAYNQAKNKCTKAKQQAIKGDKIKKTKINFERLQEKCYLFNEFTKGVKLDHNEIKHLSFNLYDIEGYPTLLENTLKEFNYNNWENKYNTYVSAVNYGYDFSSCAKHCRHYYNCHNPFTIKEKYYGKEGKIEQLHQPYLMPLADAETELQKVYNIIQNMTKEHFLFVRAVTGIGKTELLKKVVNSNIIIGVTNHKLGLETFERLQPYNKDLLYVKALDTSNMPKDLEKQIKVYYDLGLCGEVRDLIIEEINKLAKVSKKPPYYEDMVNYISTLNKIPDANTMLLTHHRISFGNNNSKIDTIIFDEDFLKSFINYSNYEYAHIFKDLNDLKEYCEKLEHNKDAQHIVKIIDKFLNEVREHKGNQDWFENSLKTLITNKDSRKILLHYTKENKDKISSNIFKVMGAEYVTLRQDKFLHTVSGEALKELSKYKVVVMSATVDDEIHPMFVRKYLPKKNILFKDISNVETQGGIMCDCAYAFSRQGLNNRTDKQQKALDQILSSDKYNNIISFMDDDLIDVKPYGKNKILHYGATEGIDAYKGQNLCVIGTPHNNSVLYEAYGVLLTGKSPKSDKWKVKEVEKYGYKFGLNTYENEEDALLTRIQLYMLYSELIQAVGRARILRTDAKVYVFSALPLPNALIKDVNKSKMKCIDEVVNDNVLEYINNAKELEDIKTELVEVMTNEEILKELGF